MALSERSFAAGIFLAALPFLAAAQDCPEPASPTQREEAFGSIRQGQEFLEAGRWPEAEALFLAATRLDPLLPLAHYGLGETLMAEKRYPEAVGAFTACKEAFRCVAVSLPERTALLKLLDAATQDLRDVERGIEQTRAARALILWQAMNNDTPPTLGESALLVQQVEKRVMVLQEWRRRIAAPRHPPEVPLALGSAYFQMGSFPDAEREYREAVEIDPRMGDAHNNLAVVYMLRGRLKEAESEVRLAERAGTAVSPRLKEEIRKRKAQAR